jgi:predicted secreted protein
MHIYTKKFSALFKFTAPSPATDSATVLMSASIKKQSLAAHVAINLALLSGGHRTPQSIEK